MSEKKSEAGQASKEKKSISVSSPAGCIIICLVFGFFAVFIFGASVFLEIPYYLLIGWVIFLIANVTTLEMNWEMVGCGVGALLLAVFGFHRFLIWVRKDKSWKWAWTISMTALILMLFAASIAMTGIIHQLGWIAHEPLTQSSNRKRTLLTHNTSNAKQMFYLLVEFDQDNGKLPDSLQLFVANGDIEASWLEELMFRPERGSTPEPWIYLGAGETIFGESEDKETDDYPLLISPQSIRGKWVVLRRDGAVKQLLSSGVRREYPWLLERLPNLMEGN